MIRNIPLLLDETSKKIRSHTDIAVLGMSGGADSTLVSILCRQALGPEHVFSLHMPMNENDYSYFNRLSQDVAKHLGLRILTTPIIYAILLGRPLPCLLWVWMPVAARFVTTVRFCGP
jgi:NH3-dependent NAD+ synthetase